jgi:hypothetical protein
MKFMEWWVLNGFIGWIILMAIRQWWIPMKRPAREYALMSYVRGFIFSLVLGPICYVFAVAVILINDAEKPN